MREGWVSPPGSTADAATLALVGAVVRACVQKNDYRGFLSTAREMEDMLRSTSLRQAQFFNSLGFGTADGLVWRWAGVWSSAFRLAPGIVLYLDGLEKVAAAYQYHSVLKKRN